MEQTFEPTRPMDPIDKVLKGAKYTIVETLVDNYNPDRATELATGAIKANPDLACFVGLFASNTPAILKALDQTGKLGKIKVVGFDANDDTVAGIEKGYVYASIVQDAYNIGYYAVQFAAEASRGDPAGVPLFPNFYLRCDPWTKDNLDAMRKAKASRLKPTAGASGTPAPPATAPAE
jgi:ABC-type sugar transport system substrate-binding protein